MNFKLTIEQSNVIKGLLDWANDLDSDLMAVLKGFAGTGKTTVLKYFLEQYKHSVAVTAPTHKAVEVASKILNRRGITLHKLHGLKPNTNLASFDIDNVKFEPLGKESMKDFSLIIIDECSMINAGLAGLNKSRAEQNKIKVLFVGDPYQLPPIGERYSSTFSLPTAFQLNKVLRQNDSNPVSKILPLLRNDIKNNNSFHALQYMLSKPVNINICEDGVKEGYAILTPEQFERKLVTEIPDILNGVRIKYLSGINTDVIDKNNFIRYTLFNQSDIIVQGDLLVSDTNTSNEFKVPILTNSSEYEVISVSKMDSDFGFEIFVVDLKNIQTGALVPSIKVVNHKHKVGWEIYKNELYRVYLKAINSGREVRSANWGKYFKFKNQYLQMIKVDFGKKKIVDRDISYAYASTVHKSQGSTYDTSYINLKNIVLTQKGVIKANYP